jgi:methionyl-tRNA formyltransferase
VQHALIAGDEITGATTFRLEAGLDTGPVYGVLTEAVRPTDTSGDLLARLADAGAGLLLATLDGIEAGSLTPRPQAAEGISLAPKLDVADARVDWQAPASRVDRLVRGCTPAPGAWTVWRGERLKLWPVRPSTGQLTGEAERLAPGEVRVGRREVEVGTGTVPVVLGMVQPPGKRAMPAADWARGSRLEPGERLGAESVEPATAASAAPRNAEPATRPAAAVGS